MGNKSFTEGKQMIRRREAEGSLKRNEGFVKGTKKLHRREANGSPKRSGRANEEKQRIR
ncbi:hypothetical protein [Bacteroides pyogenes]|uniref:hypothetical protein n=1 Tax=Bacteroides pyogenes TaxID=310300 RepID=UPI001BA88AB6|nr:hypothetical protein [Bacteroides pyogenes]